MSTNSPIITGGISTTAKQDYKPEDLAPNNYLTIIWKDTTDNNIINTLDIDDKEAQQFNIELQNSIDSAISNNNVSYIGQNRFVNMESIAKYLAQNSIDAGTKRTVVNALIGVASGSKEKLSNDVINLCLNVFGNIADKTARELDLTDPQQIFSQVAGENVVGLFKTLGDKTKNFLDECISKINSTKKTDLTSSVDESDKKYVGLLLGLTTSDTESYEITIPRKKVENGSDYTTHLLPQPFKKDFTVILTNKIIKSNFSQLEEITNIEYTKDKLIEIAKSKIPFDIYIRLSKDKIYKRSNVYFSSLSFAKDEGSGNTYTATFSIEPINEFKTKIFVSNKKYSTGIDSKGTGSNSSGSTNREQSKKTNNGNSLEVGWANNPIKIHSFKSFQEVENHAKRFGYDIYYNEASNPKYYFTNAVYVKDVDGKPVYALADDTKYTLTTISKTSGDTSGFRGPVRKNVFKDKNTFVEKDGNKFYIITGKEKYTIYKYQYGSITSK